MNLQVENSIWNKATGEEWKIKERATHPEDEPPIKWKCGRWINRKYEVAIFAEDELTDDEPPPRATISIPESLAVDRQVLVNLRKALPSEGGIKFLRYNNFAGFAFNNARIDNLRIFLATQDAPDAEFLDSDLEGLRGRLAKSIDDFFNAINRYTFPLKDNFYGVPDEWEETQPQIFEQAVTEIHTAASLICDRYDELIRTARQRLNVV